MQGPEAAQPAAARQRPATAKPTDAAPPAARRHTSTAALLVQRSTEADAARPSTAEPSAPATEDIDQADRLDNRAAAEYVSHIFSYFQRVEPLYRVSPSYMAKQVGLAGCTAAPALGTQLTLRAAGAQTDINEKMRAILVDWLVEVHFKFKVGLLCMGNPGSLPRPPQH